MSKIKKIPEYEAAGVELIMAFRTMTHVQQAALLAEWIPKVTKKYKKLPDTLALVKEIQATLEAIHESTVNSDTFVKPTSNAIPAKSKRIEKLCADLKAKYAVPEKGTIRDFRRICKGEKIIIVNGVTQNSYCFNSETNGMNITIGKKSRLNAHAGFYLLGSLLIPSTFKLAKFIDGKLTKREYQVKSSESNYFSKLMRGEVKQ